MKHKLGIEDAALWAAITQSVTPLHRKKNIEQADRAIATMEKKQVEPSKTEPPRTASPRAIKAPVLEHGLGIERRAGRNLRKADRPYQASIDLHGMTQDMAHRTLKRFLGQAQQRGHRCVLVITGKGGLKGAGILRREVPRWLNEPEFRASILAFDHAAPKHGGEGALYILLKKKS